MAQSDQEVASIDPLVLGELLKCAANNLWLGIILFGSDRRVIFCNPRYREMYALSPEQVRPGTPIKDLIQHRLKLGLNIGGEAGAYVRARTEGSVVSEQTVQQFADGRIIAYTIHPLPDGGGMATHEDITEREELSARLQERNFQFDIAINNMSQGLCFFSADHRLLVCNTHYIEMYGLPPDRVRPGTPLQEILDLRFEAGSVPAMTREEYATWRTDVATSADAMDSIVEMRNGRTFKIRHRPMPRSRMGRDARRYHRAAQGGIADRAYGAPRRADGPRQSRPARSAPQAGARTGRDVRDPPHRSRQVQGR